MKYIEDYTIWVKIANQIGWVHCHDNLVVVDDPTTGECLGEFNDKTKMGWIQYEN